MHQHGVVHRLDQPLEQLLAVVESGAALLEGLEQLIDRAAQLSQRVRLALEADAARSALFACKLLDLAREVVDGALLAAFPGQQKRMPAAKIAEVRNHKTMGDEGNSDLVVYSQRIPHGHGIPCGN